MRNNLSWLKKLWKFSKMKVRFEISTFEIGYRQNFVKIRKLLLFSFWSKMSKFWDSDSKFSKTNVNSELFELGYIRNFVKIRELILLEQNGQIWAFGLEIWKANTRRKLQIFPILKFWVVLGCFIISLGRFCSFRLVSARFGSFCVSVSTIVGELRRRACCTSDKFCGSIFFNWKCLLAFENFSLRTPKKTPSLLITTPSVTWTEE